MRQRLERHLLAQLVALGEHHISGLLCAAGRQSLDWSADYRMYSRCRIDPQRLFDQVRAALLEQLPDDEALLVSIDDTRVRKSGRKVAGARYARDPLGPRFRVNFIWAQRFLQISQACGAGADARMIPIDWQHAPTLKKPAAKASEDERKAYRQACREHSLGRLASAQLHRTRKWFDQHQALGRTLWCTVDGGYTNRTVLKTLPANSELIGRIRCDAKLHFLPQLAAGRKGRKRVYGETAPTPEQLRQDDNVAWEKVRVWIGSKQHELRVKTLGPLRWRPAGAEHDLKLVVIAPLPYHTAPTGKRLYRKPAYLISTDPRADTQTIVQRYIRRWDIEVNFRDEKTLLGVGEAQVRDAHAVQNVTATQVAAYALLLAAARDAPCTEQAFALPRPKWQRKPPVRATTQRLIQQLRYELWGHAMHFSGFAAPSSSTRSPGNALHNPFPAVF
jgi:hypothetical protein